MITVFQALLIVLVSAVVAVGVLSLGALMAAWLIGRGMVAIGREPLIGQGKGEAFSIADGSEAAFPIGAGPDEKHVQNMAADFLQSFTGRPM